MRYPLLSLILFIIVAIPVAQGQDVVYLIRHAEQELYLDDPPLTYVRTSACKGVGQHIAGCRHQGGLH